MKICVAVEMTVSLTSFVDMTVAGYCGVMSGQGHLFYTTTIQNTCLPFEDLAQRTLGGEILLAAFTLVCDSID